ncbi:uncharacterized protein LOC6033249 [Culex quinquefasciatus]|uniref:uncharacterized protein LOC6033249 n=1 Tax=Culex quinquefasciatus TaxID=7176 RepID=UPI0018E3965E|nr:uncharacterized protein LOC6033249 [Culex quinquefasciatus]
MLLTSAFLMLFITSFKISYAVLSIDFDDDFRICENGKPLPEDDFSQFHIQPEQDGSITMNGTYRFKQEYGSPTRWNMYTERLERGSWIPGIVSRDVRDICLLLQMPHEVWYPYTHIMKQKSCPYRVGHEEHINNMNIGNFAAMLKVPPSFIGEWRMYYEITSTRNVKRVVECMMIPITVSEV